MLIGLHLRSGLRLLSGSPSFDGNCLFFLLWPLTILCTFGPRNTWTHNLLSRSVRGGRTLRASLKVANTVIASGLLDFVFVGLEFLGGGLTFLSRLHNTFSINFFINDYNNHSLTSNSSPWGKGQLQVSVDDGISASSLERTVHSRILCLSTAWMAILERTWSFVRGHSLLLSLLLKEATCLCSV